MTTTTTSSRPRRTVEQAIAADDPAILATCGGVAASIRSSLERLAQMPDGHTDLEGHSTARIRAALEYAWQAPAAARPDPAWPKPDVEQIRRFLHLLGKPKGTVRLRAFYPSGDPRKAGDKGRKAAGDLGLIERWQAEGRGIYAVVNDGGDNDREITACRALFCEWDDRPVEWQVGAWRELGLPEPSFIVATGGKSVHCYWVLREPIEPDAWKPLQQRLLEHADADRTIKNPARVMRLPGCWYMHPGNQAGELAQIIHESSKRYDPLQIAACLHEPEPTPAPAPAAPPSGLPDAVSLAQLLPRDLERLAAQGAPEGSRNAEAFRLAAVAVAVADAAPAAGLRVDGTPEAVLLAFAARCSPPLAEREALTCLRSAESQPRSVDPGWPGRLRFHLNRLAKRHRNREEAEAVLVEAEVLPGPEPKQLPRRSGRDRHKLEPDEVLELLPERLGTLRLNVRSGDVHTRDGVLNANEISRLYLQLSNADEKWGKEVTADAVALLASQNPFDPVETYLSGIKTEPLPIEQWQRLDQHLLGIDDPIAAAFLPRYFISAVARAFEPGCDVRQVPVLIGPQWRGKSALGRILFGAEHWVEGVDDLGKDALMKARSAWGVELAELDGVTRRSDQERLKAFITETVDTYRAPYDRSPERHPRRFVFWATSNGAPLRDSTGSTRFVCIKVPDRMLPLEWARHHRDALWARALEQYRAGAEWRHGDEAERQAIEARNADHAELDPWAERVATYLSKAQQLQQLPVKVAEVLAHLEVPVERQTNLLAKRVRAIAQQLGWEHARRRQNGGAKQQGLWPVEPGTPSGHPGHPGGHPSGTPADPTRSSGSEQMGTPVTPKSEKLEKSAALHEGVAGGTGNTCSTETFSSFGVPGMPAAEIHCAAVDLQQQAGVPAGVPRGVPGTVTELVEAGLQELRLAPHRMHLPELVAWLRSQPGEAECSQRQIGDALERLQQEDRETDQIGLEVGA